jgi:hypothetical protein
MQTEEKVTIQDKIPLSFKMKQNLVEKYSKMIVMVEKAPVKKLT